MPARPTRAAAAPTLQSFRAALRSVAHPERAEGAARFFKTGPGQYGEGDAFLGITVPDLRRVVRAHHALATPNTLELLQSRWHEERAAALMLLVHAHQRASSAAERRRLHRAYLANTRWINNWDLVDVSAAELVGSHIEESGGTTIARLAGSKSLWERRIAIIATFHTLRAGDFDPTFRIARLLLGDSHDLIHKAVGWMLREVGKRDGAALRAFLRAHGAHMPRTALRYAIERFPEEERQRYLALRQQGSSV